MTIKKRLNTTTSKSDILIEDTTTWLGTKIARKHSFLKTIKEIVNHQLQNEVTSIGLQGREGTGKSTLAKILAHEIHTEMSKKTTSKDIPQETREKIRKGYSVHFLNDNDLIHFQDTIDSMPNSNRIIVFDDVSFLTGKASKKELDHLKNAFTTIRHQTNGEDVKTVIIFCYHYSRGLDIYLRDTVVRYFTSIRAEEVPIIASLIGGSDMRRIKTFQQKYAEFNMGKPITFVLGKKGTKNRRYVKYEYGKPFRIAAYYNNSGVSICVYPKAEALVPKDCSICNNKATNIDYNLLNDWLISKYTNQEFQQAIRYLAISKYGVPYIKKSIKQVNECITRLTANGVINLDRYLEATIKNSKQEKSYKAQQHQNRIEISQELQTEFKNIFGIDGLRSSHTPEQKKISKPVEVDP